MSRLRRKTGAGSLGALFTTGDWWGPRMCVFASRRVQTGARLTFPCPPQTCALACTSVSGQEPDIFILSTLGWDDWREAVLFISAVHQSALGHPKHIGTHTHARTRVRIPSSHTRTQAILKSHADPGVPTVDLSKTSSEYLW